MKKQTLVFLTALIISPIAVSRGILAYTPKGLTFSLDNIRLDGASAATRGAFNNDAGGTVVSALYAAASVVPAQVESAIVSFDDPVVGLIKIHGMMIHMNVRRRAAP